MATRIIEGARARANFFAHRTSEPPTAQMSVIIDELGRASRLAELLGWIQRARALATELEAAASLDQVLLQLLDSHQIRFRTADLGAEASAGLREVRTETETLVSRAYCLTHVLRDQMSRKAGEQA